MQQYSRFTKLTGILMAGSLVATATPVNAQLGNVNLIFGISGDVWIKRVGSQKYQRASGGLINLADKLRLGKGATAKVICGKLPNNIRRWQVSAPGEFIVDSGCYPGKRKINIRPGSLRCCTRNINNPKIPYLISPRNTKILHNQPISLRWNPVDGASRYQVSIFGSGLNWKTEVSQPEVVYSGKKNFKPGYRYRIIVTSDKGLSSTSELPVGFTVLSEKNSQKIQAEISQLQQINANTHLRHKSSNYLKAFAQVEIYHSYGLNNRAIEILERLIEQDSKTRAVYQRLGKIYQEVGLNRLAKQRYLAAIELSEKEQTLEGQQETALIQLRLGEVNQVIGDLEDSYKWYQAARDSFAGLGDKEQSKLLEQKLDYLKERL